MRLIMSQTATLVPPSAACEDNLVIEDDIVALQHFLGAASVQYVDVAMSRAHQQVLQRWPLLSEMDASV